MEHLVDITMIALGVILYVVAIYLTGYFYSKAYHEAKYTAKLKYKQKLGEIK